VKEVGRHVAARGVRHMVQQQLRRRKQMPLLPSTPNPSHPTLRLPHVGRPRHAAVDGGVGLGGGVHSGAAVEGGQVGTDLRAALRTVELGVQEGDHQGVVGVAGGAEALGTRQRLHVANVGGHPAAAGRGGEGGGGAGVGQAWQRLVGSRERPEVAGCGCRWWAGAAVGGRETTCHAQLHRAQPCRDPHLFRVIL
jgi:hypothetical protein